MARPDEALHQEQQAKIRSRRKPGCLYTGLVKIKPGTTRLVMDLHTRFEQEQQADARVMHGGSRAARARTRTKDSD